MVFDLQSCQADLRYDDLGIVAWFDKPLDQERFASVVDRIKLGRGPPRILHVEDDPTMRQLVAHRLRRDFEVVPAATLKEAQEALLAGDFEASVLDLRLPDGRGATLLPNLHDGAGDDLPLVVHSGNDVEAAVGARAGAVVAKSPGSINEVAAALLRLLGHSRRDGRKRSDA